MENWHSQLPILLNGGYNEDGEWKDAKDIFSFTFLSGKFQFENFDWDEIPEENFDTVYCLSISSTKDTEYKHLWFEKEIEADIMEAYFDEETNVFSCLRCNVPKREIFISVKRPS